MVGANHGPGSKQTSASGRPANSPGAGDARAAQGQNLRILELPKIPKPLADDRPIVSAMLASDLQRLGDYINGVSASEFGPQMHRVQALRTIITRRVLSEISTADSFSSLVSALPVSEDGMRSAAFKISMRSAESRNIEDPHMKDLVRAHLLVFPPGLSRAPDGGPASLWMYGIKAPESAGAKHRQMLLEGPMGKEWSQTVQFSDVHAKYSRMRTSSLYGASERFRILGRMIEALERRAALEAELLHFASRGRNADEAGAPNRWLGFDGPATMRELSKALAEVDKTHKAATSYRLASKSLILPQDTGRVSSLAQAMRQIGRVLTTDLTALMPRKQEMASMSRDALAKSEERVEAAMLAYTSVFWPMGSDEAGNVVQAFAVYADDATRARAAGVFLAYARTELSNLSRNELLCSSKDRIAELWAEAERMLRSLGSSGAEPEHARQLCTRLAKFSEILQELGRTEKGLDSALRSLRESVRRADRGGQLSYEEYSQAMASLCETAKLRSAMLCNLRDAYTCVRGMKQLDRANALGGTAAMLDTISQLFKERGKCNFRDESDLLKEFELTCGGLRAAGSAGSSLRKLQEKIVEYRAHLRSLRGSEHEKALAASTLVRPKDDGALHVDPYAAHEAALRHLPTLLRQYMQYLLEREQSHSAYRQQHSRPYYPPSAWVTPGNFAEYLMLRTEYYKARGKCRIVVGEVPLVELERDVRAFLDRASEINGGIISAMMEYEKVLGDEAAPLRAGMAHARFSGRRSQVLRDEYPAKKHYGAANEYPLDLHVEISEEAGSVRVRVESATANLHGLMVELLPSQISMEISEAELMEHFNERTYAMKSHAEVTLGGEVTTDITKYKNDVRKLGKGIPFRASTVKDLRDDPFAMLVADLQRQRALNGALVLHGGSMYERLPRIIGTHNTVELLAQDLFGSSKDARKAGNGLLRTYDEETRASVYRAFFTGLYAELPAWLMNELKAVEAEASPRGMNSSSY